MRAGHETNFLWLYIKCKYSHSEFVVDTVHIVFDLLTGNLHFMSIQLTDGQQQLPGKYRTYACACSNDFFGTISFSADHSIIPISGTIVREVAVFVLFMLTSKVSQVRLQMHCKTTCQK